MGRLGSPRMRAGVIVGALTVAALGLRLPGFASRPLWYDEAEQYYISSARTWPEVLGRLAIADRNPPGFALAEWAALRLGDGEGWMRLPSLLAGVATVAAAYYAARAWSGRRAGLVAATLATALPPWVFYAREARPYASGLLADLLFLHAVALRLRRPGRARSAYLLATSVVAVCWQYANLFIVVAGLLAGSYFRERRSVFLRTATLVSGRDGPASVGPTRPRQPRPGRPPGGPRPRWLAAGAVGLVAAVLFGTLAFPQVRAQGMQSEFLRGSYYVLCWPLDAPRFAAVKPVELLDFLATGTASDGAGWPVVLLAWLPLIAGAAALRRGGRGRSRALALAALAPVLALLVAAGVRLHPFGGIRHCLPLTPGLVLLYAAGWRRVERRSRPVAWASLAILLGLSARGSLVTVRDQHVEAVRELMRGVVSRSRPGDAAAFSVLSGSIWRYETRASGEPFASVVYCDGSRGRCGPDEVRPPARPRPADIEARVIAALRDSPRLWAISSRVGSDGLDALLSRHASRSLVVRAGRAEATLWVRREDGSEAVGRSVGEAATRR